jgi:hypothetical protein
LTSETPRVADWDSAVRDFLRRAGRRSGLNLSGEALDALPKSYRYLVPARRAARDLALIAANQSESEIVELRPLPSSGADVGRYEVRLIGANDHALDELRERGRGIFFIRSVMDSVQYHKTDSGNVLEMRKKIA